MCDMIYESYLVNNPDAQAQYEEHQRLLVEQDPSKKNRYTYVQGTPDYTNAAVQKYG